MAKAKQFVNGVRYIIMTKRVRRTADDDVHRSSDDKLEPHMFAGVGQNAEEI